MTIGSGYLAMATLSTTVKITPLPVDERKQHVVCDSPSGNMRCAVVSSCAERLDSIRLAAEQEAWEAIVFKDTHEMLRCAFRGLVPLSIVDMPRASDVEYQGYRALTEQLGELGGNDMLLVVCAAAESVQEEIWARQLGVWSYLPIANLSLECLRIRPDGNRAEERKSENMNQGLTLVFGEARIALAKLVANSTDPRKLWDQRTSSQS